MPADVIEKVAMLVPQNMNNAGLPISARNQNPTEGSNDQDDDGDDFEYEMYPEYDVTDPEDERYIEFNVDMEDDY
jgi:hypothetical protein